MCLLEFIILKLHPWHEKTQWACFDFGFALDKHFSFLIMMVFSSLLTVVSSLDHTGWSRFHHKLWFFFKVSIIIKILQHVYLQHSFCSCVRTLGTILEETFWMLRSSRKISMQCLCPSSWLQLSFRHLVGGIYQTI